MKTNQPLSKQISYWLGVISIGLVVGLGIQFAKAWTAPIAMPPSGNIGAPVNTGSAPQTKDGSLGVTTNLIVGLDAVINTTAPSTGTGGQLKLDVEGNVGAQKYCDQDGNNCKTIAELGSGGGSTAHNVCYWGGSVGWGGTQAVCNDGYFMAGVKSEDSTGEIADLKIYCCRSNEAATEISFSVNAIGVPLSSWSSAGELPVGSISTFEGCGLYCGYSPNEGGYNLYGTVSGATGIVNIEVGHWQRYGGKYTQSISTPYTSSYSGNFNEVTGGVHHTWKYDATSMGLTLYVQGISRASQCFAR